MYVTILLYVACCNATIICGMGYEDDDDSPLPHCSGDVVMMRLVQ